MLSGNLNGKTHFKVNSSGNSDAEKTKADSQLYKKKKKSAYEKRGQKNRIADVREKRARFAKRFSANGPFRTAAILPFWAVCFYTRRMLVSASVASRLVQDKHTPKCQFHL